LTILGARMAKARKKRKGGAGKPVVGIIAAVLIVAVGVVAYLLALQPVTLEKDYGATQIVRVEPGRGAGAVGALLEQKGLIRHAWAFTAQAYLTGRFRRLKAGSYQLSSAMSTGEIVASMARGKSALRSVTFPEGLTLEETAAVLGKAGICEAPAFLDAATPEAVDQALGTSLASRVPQIDAAGFLFPDTYLLGHNDDPARVIAMMLAEFKEKFYDPYWLPAVAQKPWGNILQVVTLASLVEKEARVDSDRPLIAGVLVHRIRTGMRLQCDATVQYALGRHKAHLTDQDLKADSPYNTYLHNGLPPGPICNPGLPSLQAALHPAATDYLFYVAKPEGTHIFTKTYPEHLAAKKSLHGGW
jgi:UPF0755 protein